MSSARTRASARVPAELAGARLDQAAADVFAPYSRALVASWLRLGCITVDGKQRKPSSRVLGGELLELDAPDRRTEDWVTAEPVPFRIVYEDDAVLVIDKPAGVVVHPGAGNPSGTLVNGLLRVRPELAALPRAGLIHRLDKDTSGLLCVAAAERTRMALLDAMRARAIERRYTAVCEGHVRGEMIIDRPVGRDPRNRTRQAVRSDGRSARTTVVAQRTFQFHTLVACRLHTGRTHQIRVHLAAVGHPLVGDTRYGASGRDGPPLARSFARQALHASELAFEHPHDGRAMRFSAPLPDDMTALLQALDDASRKDGP